MSAHKIVPLSWTEFVRRLRNFGFDGPFQGGRHPYMIKGDIVLTIPNPHRNEISFDLIVRIIRQAGISHEAWVA